MPHNVAKLKRSGSVFHDFQPINLCIGGTHSGDGLSYLKHKFSPIFSFDKFSS